MSTTNAGNLAKGMYILYKDAPHQVVKADFMNPGKGSPIMRSRLRNIKTGQVQEFTYKTNESVEIADIEKKEMQFLYKDQIEAVFMDPRDYDQVPVPLAVLDDQANYLMPDMKCWVTWFEGQPVGVMLPPHVSLKVVESPDMVAGNRVNAPKKPVVLENGLEVQVPLFIKAGETVIIDTTSGEYVSRDTQA